MPVITVLPVDLRNKIAAGEVVERPASVVKELIENAIDASATRIAVETLRAGKKLIHVSDNGTGMDREDAVRAFERYATSKIKDEQDLFNLKTMGFRGEALSSLAAVSRMKLVTRYNPAEGGFPEQTGTCVEVAGGEVKSGKDCAASGTGIEVRELFFNTPARRKFLKSDATENYHIIDTVTREALSHPHICFTLRMDSREVFSLPAASSPRERLVQLYGKEFIDGMIECSLSDTEMSINIFTSALAHMRNNRSMQYLFVNSRPVKDQAVAVAVYKAYEGLVPKEAHPAFFIFLDIDAGQVDFNVHPTKREVRFANKSSLFNFVYHAAREGLKKDPGFGLEKPGAVPGLPDGCQHHQDWSQPREAVAAFSGGIISEDTDTFSTGPIPVLYLGETFVAVAGRGGIVLLDYHAAHERVNYERFLKRMDIQPHRLLFPHQVKLPRGEYAVLLEHLPLLKETGLEAEDFGHDTILIRSIPETLRDADMVSLLSDIASALLEVPVTSSAKSFPGAAGHENEVRPVESIRKSIAARLACHSSIRGKEIPDGIKVAELLKSLDATDNPHSCPHGRPTRIFISLDELRKMFKK